MKSKIPGHGENGSNRDGSSVENAIVVNSVEEEYAWIQHHHTGFRLARQALRGVDDKMIDVLMLCNDENITHTIYFDITNFFNQRSEGT
jgi:hypothetical protein